MTSRNVRSRYIILKNGSLVRKPGWRVGGDGPADADALDHLRQVGAEFNVDHPVDRLTAIESFHAFAPTGLPVVEDLVCTN